MIQIVVWDYNQFFWQTPRKKPKGINKEQLIILLCIDIQNILSTQKNLHGFITVLQMNVEQKNVLLLMK